MPLQSAETETKDDGLSFNCTTTYVAKFVCMSTRPGKNGSANWSEYINYKCLNTL